VGRHRASRQVTPKLAVHRLDMLHREARRQDLLRGEDLHRVVLLQVLHQVEAHRLESHQGEDLHLVLRLEEGCRLVLLQA
jgi:hypothetical protein